MYNEPSFKPLVSRLSSPKDSLSLALSNVNVFQSVSRVCSSFDARIRSQSHVPSSLPKSLFWRSAEPSLHLSYGELSERTVSHEPFPPRSCQALPTMLDIISLHHARRSHNHPTSQMSIVGDLLEPIPHSLDFIARNHPSCPARGPHTHRISDAAADLGRSAALLSGQTLGCPLRPPGVQ